MRNKGFTLIFTVFLITALLIILSSAGFMVYNSSSSLMCQRDQVKAYYLAESAIEYAKAQLKSNPNWCTPGTTIQVKNGSFAMKKECGKPIIYGDGYSNHAHVIIRADVVNNNSYIQREE